VPILKSVASRGEGIDELLDQIAEHRSFLTGDEGQARLTHQSRELFDRFLALVGERRTASAAAG